MNSRIYNLIGAFVQEGGMRKVAKEIETVVNERAEIINIRNEIDKIKYPLTPSPVTDKTE